MDEFYSYNEKLHLIADHAHNRMQEMDEDYWLDQWERQQNMLVERREERFELMLDLVAETQLPEVYVLDLGCGPGSLCNRIIDRSVDWTVDAVDYDPLLLHIARSAVGVKTKKIRFVEADLNDAGWPRKLPHSRYNAVLSTTALHWLPLESLRNVYSQIFSLLVQGGIFVNGDHMHPKSEQSGVRDLFDRIRHGMESQKKRKLGALNWGAWWSAISSDPKYSELYEERTRRYGTASHHGKQVPLELHMKLLKSAGFENVDLCWQYLDNRILMAFKP